MDNNPEETHEERVKRETEEHKVILDTVREESDRYDAAVANGEDSSETTTAFVLGNEEEEDE